MAWSLEGATAAVCHERNFELKKWVSVPRHIGDIDGKLKRLPAEAGAMSAYSNKIARFLDSQAKS